MSWLVFAGLFLAANLAVLLVSGSGIPATAGFRQVPLGLRSNEQQAAAKLDGWLSAQQLTLKVGTDAVTAPAKEIGVTIDHGASLSLIKTKGLERFFPLIPMALNRLSQPDVVFHYDDTAIDNYLKQHISENETPAENARLVFDKATGTVDIAPNTDGLRLSVRDARNQLKLALNRGWDSEIIVEPVKTRPVYTAVALEPEKARLQKLSASPWKLSFKGQAFEIPIETARNLLTLADNDTKAVLINDAAKQHLMGLVGLAFEDAEDTVLQLNESARDMYGNDALDADKALVALAGALQNGRTERIDLPLRPILPSTQIKAAYSRDDAGLNQLIKDFVASHGGDHRIIIEELGGLKRRASYQETKSTVPASTYKAFLATVTLKKMEEGKFNWDTPTSYTNVRKSMETMILVSTNPPAYALQDLIGWPEVDSVLHGWGFKDTVLNNKSGGQKNTTVKDEATLFKSLYNGELITTPNRDYLFGLFKRQMWRTGIPSGSGGSVVADKVGFYASWTHDIGIVYSPSGDYLLAVMTKGGSFYTIQALAKQVYKFFNP